MRRIELLRDSVVRRYDYNVYSAFRNFDRYNDGFINSVNLDSLLRYHHHYLTEKDLLCIIRRIDTDGDAKISYSEFSDFLRTEYLVERPIEISNDYKPRSASESKRPRFSATSSSPLRKQPNNYHAQNLTSTAIRNVNFNLYESNVSNHEFN
jgi:hypothetical protein